MAQDHEALVASIEALRTDLQWIELYLHYTLTPRKISNPGVLYRLGQRDREVRLRLLGEDRLRPVWPGKQ